MRHGSLFSFQGFVKSMRCDDRKKVVEKYEECFGSLVRKGYKQTAFFKEYLSKIKIDEDLKERLVVPSELPVEFDYMLLLVLVIGSFSSTYTFEYDDKTDKVRLKITTKSDNQSITKYLDDLWGFQIMRLFEIYFEEQMNLAVLTKDSNFEKLSIERERTIRIKAYLMKLENMKRERAYAPKRQELMGKFHKLIENV